MSTTIYNAYRIKANSLDEVINYFFKEKITITKAIEDYLIKEVLLEMLEIYDKISLIDIETKDNEKNQKFFIENENRNINSIVFKKFLNRNEPSQEDDDKEDNKVIEGSIILYPQPIEHFGEKNYLLQLWSNSEINEIIAKNIKNKGAEDYSYWNNTDQKDTITDYEWELRKQNWKNINTPLLDGISIIFLKSSKYEVYFSYNSKKEYIQNLLNKLVTEFSLEKRVDKYTNKIKQEIAYKECYENFIKINKLENIEHSKLVDIIIRKGMGIYIDSLEQAKENNFNENQMYEIQEKRKQIAIKLKEKFSLEDFNITCEDIKNMTSDKVIKKLKF